MLCYSHIDVFGRNTSSPLLLSMYLQPHHKFGVSVVEACSLVKMAKDQGLTVNGIS